MTDQQRRGPIIELQLLGNQRAALAYIRIYDISAVTSIPAGNPNEAVVHLVGGQSIHVAKSPQEVCEMM